MADAALLHRVIANLLDNELKHLPAACTICLGLSAEAEFVVLRVEDDGPGFEGDLARQIFEQGVKGSASRGHGLGLAFVSAVVRVHGGSVTAANRRQGGAEFVLRWPGLDQANEAEHPMELTAS
jgi:signal transduction histidine kinase